MMAEPKGYKLFVNLGASQTRRRLKGFGHGVRKIQTAGHNQAVIIHTARRASSACEVGRFETETLNSPRNLTALMKLSGRWIDTVHQQKPSGTSR